MDTASTWTNVKQFFLGIFLVFGIGLVALLFLPKIISVSILAIFLGAIAIVWIEPEGLGFKRPVKMDAPLSGASISLILCIFISAVSDMSIDYKSLPAKSDTSLAKAESILMIQAQENIRNHLKDPRSAEFRNTYVRNINGASIFCGEVNSKNSFGAYKGFQRFVATGSHLFYLEEEAKNFSRIWSKMCV